jgi:hypothetical protein
MVDMVIDRVVCHGDVTGKMNESGGEKGRMGKGEQARKQHYLNLSYNGNLNTIKMN